MPARLTEVRIARASFAVLALHFVDANFLQPRPGTSAGDHLTSGLLPAAILVAAGVIYPRLRAGVRAAMAMTFGALGIAIGFPGAYYLLDGTASGAHYSGLLAMAAGAVLLATGPVTLWRSRRTGGSRRQRYVRRAATVAVGHARCRCHLRLRRLPNRLLLRLHACRPHRAARLTSESRSRP